MIENIYILQKLQLIKNKKRYVQNTRKNTENKEQIIFELNKSLILNNNHLKINKIIN